MKLYAFLPVLAVLLCCCLSKFTVRIAEYTIHQEDIDGEIDSGKFHVINQHDQQDRRIRARLEFTDGDDSNVLLVVHDIESETKLLKNAAIFNRVSSKKSDFLVNLVGYTGDYGQIQIPKSFVLDDGILVGFPSYRFLLLYVSTH